MALLLVAAGYLLGSIPFGVIVTRLFAKKDVRAEGSGNIGATNVARVAGKKLGALVLLLDAAKGSAAVVLALWLFPQAYTLHAGAGFAAFLGHVFPVWLRFQGGKGVATALGVLVVLLPISALVGFVVWGAIVAVTRISSVGSLVGGLFAIVAGFFSGRPIEYPLLGVVLLLAMVVTHRGNIQRLLKRQENKL
ncbi:MAG: glycerol-3-phosphate 1-O-acyltransferase PlsY [Myxococcota bacterium]